MIHRNPFFALTAATAVFFVLCVAPAPALAVPVKNIVLVHGAWADGSGRKGVYDILVKDGYNVSIVQEPETSFQEDVAATKRVLAQQDGPCILVAHSYGGAVITERAKSHMVEVPGASHAVYASRPKEVAALIEEAASHGKSQDR
jgi:pimeloyl-ACP methyl ester carboxylesterase